MEGDVRGTERGKMVKVGGGGLERKEKSGG